MKDLMNRVTEAKKAARAIAPCWAIWHDGASAFRRVLGCIRIGNMRLHKEVVSCRVSSPLGSRSTLLS